MPMRYRLTLIFLVPFCLVFRAFADTPAVQVAQLPNKITLHYTSQGSGPAMVFVPGSISDYMYWNDEVTYFSKYYHVINYSRRYDYPNHNLTRAGYSSKSDAEDLAELIKLLKLENVIVVGNSSGALAALYLVINHPELVSKLVLAQPFAVSLLENLDGADAANGRKIKNALEQRMAIPMRKAFKAGNNEQGLQTYFNYLSSSKSAWKRLPLAEQHEALRNSYEWEVMMTAGVLFPSIDKKAIMQLKTPVLLLSGGKSYHFTTFTDAELHRIIPNNSQVIFKEASNQIWRQRTSLCEEQTMNFLKGSIANHALIKEK
jgi:pimeloyl-ACP methyl ester carboxylesterase